MSEAVSNTKSEKTPLWIPGKQVQKRDKFPQGFSEGWSNPCGTQIYIGYLVH